MKRLQVMLSLMLLFTILSGCNSTNQNENTEDVELTVSAAASLKDVLEEIINEFEKENKNIKIHFNLGSSGALQQQISQGAPVDLFISAAEDKFDRLVRDQMIEQKKHLAGNEIVLVVPENSSLKIASFRDLENASRIAIGTPETVPAGEYARQSLKALKLWDDVESQLVYTKDVRQALSFVEMNNVDASIVYSTDARQSKDTEIVEVAPAESHEPIVYPFGIIKNTEHPEESKQFFDYLQGDKAMNILSKHGFKDLK
ncbi:molybdate ABC transporter substrate-binding protein [Bacillus sp. CECT 9360]|uniref:molybdate ABC transporter substrate-binding protein n=1 Tax=Bacillus sp. CECT 9360 TaxID=2845821 RepID=UPI001E32456C|nr:molybdate ABC transporter substrate-binding protein [Bacillus sp. CECT 9360]